MFCILASAADWSLARFGFAIALSRLLSFLLQSGSCHYLFSLYDVYEQLLDSIHSTFIAKISGYQCRITMYVHRESVLYWMVVSFSQRSEKVQ